MNKLKKGVVLKKGVKIKPTAKKKDDKKPNYQYKKYA